MGSMSHHPTVEHPYQHLTPEVVLDALQHLGLAADGRLQALNSYENRVYRCHLDDGSSVVAKFYRPGRWSAAQIEEELAWTTALHHAGVNVPLPWVPEGQVLHQWAGFSVAVTPWCHGRPLEAESMETLEALGYALGHIHRLGAQTPFQHRPTLLAQAPDDAALRQLSQHPCMSGPWRSGWLHAAQTARNMALHRLTEHPTATRRLHGDCHGGNLLWQADRGPCLLDWDDTCSGPAVQDIWMLLNGERQQQQQQLGALLDGYENAHPFDRRELELIEPLRTLRLLQHSAWLAQRWHDPIFPASFPWFNTATYWQEQTRLLQGQVSAMQAPALVA